MNDKSSKPLSELRKLLFNVPDIYSEWYFHTKNLLLTSGLTVHASNVDLFDAELSPILSSKNDGVLIHFKLQKLTYKDLNERMGLNSGFPKDTYIRHFFPAVVLFPEDILKIEWIEKGQYRVFLTSEDDVFRPQVENSFLNPDLTKAELITRINLNLRTQNVRIKRLLESFEISTPSGLNEQETWQWLNSQDPQKVWEPLDDLQKLFEFNAAVLERNTDIYHLCLVDIFKQDIIDYMNQNITDLKA